MTAAKIATAGPTKIDPDAIYSIAAACAAVDFGESFIRGEIAEGRLVARRIGKRVLRIKGKDLQAWLDNWTTTTESLGLCEPAKDGSPSGMNPMQSIAESAIGGALVSVTPRA